VLAHLILVSVNITAGDGACSAFRVKGKTNGWVGRLRRMHGIKINEIFFINLTRSLGRVTEISCGEANCFEVAQDRPCGVLRDESNGLSEAKLSSGSIMI